MHWSRYFLLLLLIPFHSALSGQTAPNFTVTDSWGNTHRLYEDYLDKGTTVVLKIFYVACPPCNSIAPHLEPLYQQWGGGEGDVEFIELSIQEGDSDAEVNAYKTNHQTTYPAAGGDGNSVPATTPYTTGVFGLWTGTPTFVVIAPDGTLDYDVYGFGIDGTIEAIDTAIAATGAQGLQTGIIDPILFSKVKLTSTLVSEELVFDIKEEGHYVIDVLNSAGQLIESKTIHSGINDHFTMSASHISTGAYLCTIKQPEKDFMASYLFVKK
ncbi:MAG: TlpA disulfide reductase family protein [Saprospiraceae bacterium]